MFHFSQVPGMVKNNITKIKESLFHVDRDAEQKLDTETYGSLKEALKSYINSIHGENNSSEKKPKDLELLTHFFLRNSSDDKSSDDDKLRKNVLRAIIVQEDLELIKLLINNSKNVDFQYKWVETILIATSKNVNSKYKWVEASQTLLHLAASSGKSQVVNFLLKNGAHVDTKDSEGCTALHRAAISGHKDTVELLLESGADVHIEDNKGCTALHCAAISRHKGTVKLLLESGAKVHARDKDKWTPLHYVAIPYISKDKNIAEDEDEDEDEDKDEHKDVAQLLLKSGAEVSAKDKANQTPLHWASRSKFTGLVNLLIAEGALVNAQDEANQTPLHWATEEGSCEIIPILISSGAVVGCQDIKGKTPLDYAKSLSDKITDKQISIERLEKKLIEEQVQAAHCITIIFSTIAAITLFTTGTVAPTGLNITYATGIIALSTLIIGKLVYERALENSSTPNPKLENSKTAQTGRSVFIFCLA